ncbi:Calponin homology domain-containing protein [Cynara cardunculus var. scolymus]|uniref:Calponin homology domain-containing protein n=1 Tax=Cynara cardunculus var. scolymus TaxID=59895 RepID=A0A103YL12_CYNCS|nr:Calponin homology domain-containing protein [Cynara cardunculus var. scolymus]
MAGTGDIALKMASDDYPTRRKEAARWLRKTVGVVVAKDLPAEPSEEDFLQGLRSGMILCNLVNKLQPGAIPKVVEAPSAVFNEPDAEALSAYYENIRNFLVAVEDLGLPTFDFDDLEEGGDFSKVVDCLLALKSFSDWKKLGGSGSRKFSGSKSSPSAKSFNRRNSEPSMTPLSRTQSVGSDKSFDTLDQSGNASDANEESDSGPLFTIVCDLLEDKEEEDIPIIVENILNKLTEEFENRLVKRIQRVSLVTSHGLSTTETPRTLSEAIKEQERLAREEQERLEREEQERIAREEQERLRKQQEEEERAAREEQERIKRHKELLEERERLRKMKKEDRERAKREQQERIKREKELRAQEKAARKEEERMAKEQELRNTLSTAKIGVQSMQKDYLEEADNLGKQVRSVCQAAAGYKKVLEENRKLYNQVQDLKGNIRVYCRIRPFLPGQENCVTSVDYIDDDTVTVIVPSKSGREGRKASMFTKVFGPSATQEDVFADTQPLIRSVLDGFNVCIFAYGQTGSGKTYTLTGPSDLTPETMGVNYRALKDLFLISEERKDDMSYEISVNMLEIYNDEVRDLLVTDGIEIRNGAQKGMNVPDANLVPVTSTDEVVNLMNLSKKNRAVSSTDTHDSGSRSHSFLTVHVFGKDLTTGTKIRGCMHLVDLAGSEKIDDSEDEAAHVSKSLSAFGDVMVALALKSSKVNYKSCKLTQLLQDALGGQAKILVFVHVHPDLDEALETVNTLKFIERFSTVEGGAGKSGEVRELKEQIALLKAALAKKEAGEGQSQELRTSASLQELSTNSPRKGDLEDDSIDDSDDNAGKAKNPSAKQPAQSPAAKKAAAGAAAPKVAKQQTAVDSKKKKGK